MGGIPILMPRWMILPGKNNLKHSNLILHNNRDKVYFIDSCNRNISKFNPVLVGVLYEESVFMVVNCRE